VRTVSGVVLDARAAAAARARMHRDARGGFECGGGLDDLATGPPLGASGTGNGADDATVLPEGSGVRIPSGGAVLMRVHYAVKHLDGASDHSGVDLWLARDSGAKARRPFASAKVAAPVEVPCPGGVSLDPASPCSRENAFARLAGARAADERARADALLASCGIDLARATRATPSGDHLLVATSCASAAPFDGTLWLVEARLQTRGASARVEVEQPDGSWSIVLDVPRWRWTYDGTYALERGVAVHAGRGLRVSCTFDNGIANQWSALTGEPGHDAPARAPLLTPGYLVAAPSRAAEACEASLGIERAPYLGATWPSSCHEAQAVHADACGGGLDLVSRGCTPADEDASVAILQATSRQQLCAAP
jgi:hypothetical protein